MNNSLGCLDCLHQNIHIIGVLRPSLVNINVLFVTCSFLLVQNREICHCDVGHLQFPIS